ncbi:IS1380 family transposase, partial [Limnohabitans sp.]
SVVAGMVTGADSIDDLDVLRHGGMRKVVAGVRAPSTLGTFLRSFTFGHVRQLDAVNSRLLAGLSSRAPGLTAGAGTLAYLDVDDTIKQVHGYAKQGAAYGYSGVKGLNAQLACLSSPLAAPVITAARLRKGNVASAHGGKKLLREAISTARRAGASGTILVRADSAYYQHGFIGAAVKAKAWFSVTARQDAKVRAAISTIAPDGWATISYPRAVWDEHSGQWISDAQVAEVPYTAFTSKQVKHRVSARLVVRRVKDQRAGTDPGQGELFTAWRYHAFLTNSTLSTIAADQAHRDHAVIEQVIAELKDGPLAHAPSGRFTANAAWLALAVTAFNLVRAAAVLAGRAQARTRWATVRRRLIAVPARLASSGRAITMHLPRDWPWAPAWTALFAATGPPTHPMT